MPDKRYIKREPKRVFVRFGTSDLDKRGYTGNISETGMFIQTRSVFKPGSTIQVQFEVEGEIFLLQAKVIWAKKSTAQFSRVLKDGMGIRYMDPPLEWREFFHRCFLTSQTPGQ